MRMLEIGPGAQRIPGFETLDVTARGGVDHVGRAEKTPFKDNAFDLVYSSHCIEHVEWFRVEDTIREWVRILKPGGTLEVFTLDAYKCMRVLVDLEETGEYNGPGVGTWQRDKTQGDPFKMIVGRIMCYPKGKGPAAEAYKHRAIMTPKYLASCFAAAGLVNLQPMDNSEARGKAHGWYNLGLRGVKPA